MKKNTHNTHDMETSVAQVLASLRERGFRITRARRTLVELLAQPHASHTLADIISKLRGVDQATVYRILELLEGEGLVATIRVPGAPVRYELTQNHHHHIVCLDCGTLAHVPCDQRRYASAETPFAEVLGHDVLLYGRCRSCA